MARTHKDMSYTHLESKLLSKLIIIYKLLNSFIKRIYLMVKKYCKSPSKTQVAIMSGQWTTMHSSM